MATSPQTGDVGDVPLRPSETQGSLNVGIVGGGIAGLYTALYLQSKGHRVHIFEGTERIGGRVHTHYFTPENNQYYEAGAMRVPFHKFQEIFFQLVDYVNDRVPVEKQVELIDYRLAADGNLVYINGIRPQGAASNTTPAAVDWPGIPEGYQHRTAHQLLTEAVDDLIHELKVALNFESAFWDIVMRYDQYTFRAYCINVKGWNNALVDFVETMMSQTNQFNLSVPELVMQTLDFNVVQWKTIHDGMSRLPEAMAHLVGLDNITFGARVTGAAFDRVVLAIPPAALRMVVDRPRWKPGKEMAIRALHFEPLYKMGLRFKTRFWEHGTPASRGGQSTTDLPIRWIVYPSNGVGEDGPGVLLVYSWMTDATNWLPLTPLERRDVVLYCLAEVYNGQVDRNGNIINVYELFIESADHVWASSTATGDAMFLPGQFEEHFKVAREHEGPIYFAGEHLSFHHTWISGASQSALKVVRDMLHDPDLPLLQGRTPISRPPPDAALPSFLFQPNNPMFLGIFKTNIPGHSSRRWPPKGYDKKLGDGGSNDDHDDPEDGGGAKIVKLLPKSLGMLGKDGFGVVVSHLTNAHAEIVGWDKGRYYVK
ncbi:putative L-amino-acid oxidase YobN [Madurella mycetomatis]|uniref:Amine oxidase n=1 Tax=Madurella mycetomatis TaxID=100816 RepID=A0A175WBW1_9PEZI|nr:putative L-amino-acid oxidase YobN [Madurella mycetomatis]